MKIPFKKWITNKYLITTLVFMAYMIFADKNNVIEQYKLQNQFAKVKREHSYYKEQIRLAMQQKEELFSNDKNLETFARERYYMKRDNEDVFVIVSPKAEEK